MKIAIAGYGVEGEESYAYWSADPSHTITIVDERPALDRPIPPDVATILGPDALSHLEEFDLVVRTAGLAPHKLRTARKVWSATNEFFSQCPAPIIGVTGSKGKGTTASLIVAMLKASGKKVWLVGNIGTPALSVLADIQPDDIVVYELSSFQLWDIERSPRTAVLLFIEPEHLDVHTSLEDYVAAKARITRFQGPDDLLVFNARNAYTTPIAAQSVARTIEYPSQDAAHIQDGFFYYGTQQICAVETLQLKGAHNQDNALAAIDAVWQYSQDVSALAAGLHAFTGLPHRLSLVGTVEGVEYYDDSIATTPASAIAALRAFPDAPKVIILGGSSKGSDFSELATELTRHDVHALLIGDEAAHIAAACDAAGFSGYEEMSPLDATRPLNAVVRRAASLARPGGVVLLSPASASFGLFKNYSDRGEQFVAAIDAL